MAVLSMKQSYIDQMNKINKKLSSYDYKAVASSLAKWLPQEIVACIIGCIIPESGSDHTELNADEYNGKLNPKTKGWGCGEGLIQWSIWENKLSHIKEYNADKRSTQKLPTTWSEYSKGTPIIRGKKYHAPSDGKHIAGLSLDNQMLFLSLYYKQIVKEVKNEKNLAVMVAKFYQKKAGSGYYQNVKDPVERAYLTAKYKYEAIYKRKGDYNNYLASVKIANEYLKCPVKPSSIDTSTVQYNSNDAGTSNTTGGNKVNELSKASKSNILNNPNYVVLGTHLGQL